MATHRRALALTPVLVVALLCSSPAAAGTVDTPACKRDLVAARLA
jgi:hypothetical protein